MAGTSTLGWWNCVCTMPGLESAEPAANAELDIISVGSVSIVDIIEGC